MKKLLLSIVFITSQIAISQVIYVDQNATGLNNGTDWANAYTNLQTAISNLGSNTTINVAQGIYYTTETTDRSIYFNIPKDKKLFGGFPTGGGERNYDLYPTILSSNIGDLNYKTDNSYHVLTYTDSSPENELDGFIIEDGYANGPESNQSGGGGIYIINSSSTSYGLYIRNCIIRNNYAATNGGGILVSKKADIYNCKIYSNSAGTVGGGIYISTDTRIYNSYIMNNKANDNGGGVYLYGFNTAPKVINCIISNNEATEGAGLHTDDYPVINSTIVNNKGNSAIHFFYSDKHNVKNSIIWGNDGLQTSITPNETAGFSNNAVEGYTEINTSSFGLSAQNNGSLSTENYPRFIKPTTFKGNATNLTELQEILNANWYINPESALIDKGDYNYYPISDSRTPTTEISGNNRTINTLPDIGAYEAITNVLTYPLSNPHTTTVTLEGELLFAETTNVIEYGFVYHTVPNFDITIATSITNAKTSLGTFSENISGLTENNYYYRAWVKIDGTKYYASEQKFTINNLAAYYPFNGNANDESGNNHHATVVGSVLTADKDGNLNSAYYFNGAGNYIDLGDWENGGEMSFTFWARWDATNNWSRIIDIGNGQRNDDIMISNYFTSTNIDFYINKGTTENYYLFNTEAIEIGNWSFYSATVDNAGLMKIYKNGVLISENPGHTPNRLIRTEQYLGRSLYPGDGYFNGVIDELRIFNTALTSNEILNLYNFNTLKVEKFETATESAFYVSENILFFKNAQNLNEIKNIEIYNLLGQKVFETSKIEKEISLQQLKQSIYILKVESKNMQNASLKFIIH